jgi:polyisoprenoid-binding protein YceI
MGTPSWGRNDTRLQQFQAVKEAGDLLLDVERYPAITFRSQRIANDGSAWTVHAILTAHGTDAPFALKVTAAAADGNALDLQAVGTADRYAHGMTGGKGMVGRRLHLTVTTHAIKS